MSIGPKLILGAALSAAFVWAVGLYGASASEKSLSTAIKRASEARARAIIDEVDRTIHDRLTDWKAFVRRPIVQETLRKSNERFAAMEDPAGFIEREDNLWRMAPPGEGTPLMDELTGAALSEDMRTHMATFEQEIGLRIYGEIFITNRYGANVAQTNRTTDYRQDDEVWWIQASQSGDHVCNSGYDASAQMQAMALIIRVEDRDGQFLGVAKAVLNMADVLSIVDARVTSCHLSPLQSAVVITSNGTIVHRAGGTCVESKLDKVNMSWMDARLDTGSAITICQSDGKTEYLTAYAKSKGFSDFPGLGWVLILKRPTSEALGPVTELRKDILVASSVATLLAIGVVGAIAVVLSRRINILARAADEFGTGNLAAPVRLRGRDELTRLAHSLERMARDLNDNEKALEWEKQLLQEQVNERSKAEERLAMFREFAEASHQGLGWADLEGRIQYANRALCNILGAKEREEVIGVELIRFYDSNTQRRIQKEVFPTAIENGNWTGELDVHGLGGAVIPTLNNVFVIRDENGDPKWYAESMTDITERRQAEEELLENNAMMIDALEKEKRTLMKLEITMEELESAKEEVEASHAQTTYLLEAIPSVLVSLDQEDRVASWNITAEQILGVSAREALEQPLESLGIQWNSSAISACIAECRESNLPTHLKQVSFRRADGSDGCLGVTVNPLGARSSLQGGVLFIATDITDQVILQSQLAQAQKLESIGQLAAGIAHEINTPTQFVGDNARFLQDSVGDLIKVLDRYGEILSREGDPMSWEDRAAAIEAAVKELDVEFLKEEIPKAIEQSLEGVERVAKIVRSMKDFSHPGEGAAQCVDLNQAIESTVTVARNEWKYVADMVTDFDDSLPPVTCLVGEFNQVVLNIVINAAHAIADVVGDNSGEKGTITVTTRHDGKWAEVRISDTGTGIPEEYREKVFDHFFTTKEVGQGTGQGLSISHAVISEKHGGTLTFETEMGKGTTFVIRLPIKPETMTDEGDRRENGEEVKEVEGASETIG